MNKHLVMDEEYLKLIQSGGANEPLLVIYVGQDYDKLSIPANESDRYYALTDIKFNHPIEFYNFKPNLTIKKDYSYTDSILDAIHKAIDTNPNTKVLIVVDYINEESYRKNKGLLFFLETISKNKHSKYEDNSKRQGEGEGEGEDIYQDKYKFYFDFLKKNVYVFVNVYPGNNMLFSSIIQHYKEVFRKLIHIAENQSDTHIQKQHLRITEYMKYFYKEKEDFDYNLLFHRKAFRYFIEIVFGCSQSRLVQFSGTCYLNVTINGFILTDIGRRIMLNYMVSELKKDMDAFGKNFRKPLDRNICEKKTNDMIFRLMYNILFAKQDLKQNFANNSENQNMMKIFEKQYFMETRSHTYNTLIEFLKKINETNISTPTVTNEYPYFPDDFNYKTIPVLNIPLKESNKNFILYYSDQITNANTSRCFLPLELTAKYTEGTDDEIYEYTLVFCTILFNNIEEPKKPGHTILGYYCDGVPKTFDSNGKIATADWLHILNLNKLNESGMKQFNNFKSLTLTDTQRFDFYNKLGCNALYINNKLLEKLPIYENLHKEMEDLNREQSIINKSHRSFSHKVSRFASRMPKLFSRKTQKHNTANPTANHKKNSKKSKKNIAINIGNSTA